MMGDTHEARDDQERDELQAEVERLKTVAEAAATMNSTLAGEEVERLRKRVAELEAIARDQGWTMEGLETRVQELRTGYECGRDDGYAACEADVEALLDERVAETSGATLIVDVRLRVGARQHRGAAARKGGS